MNYKRTLHITTCTRLTIGASKTQIVFDTTHIYTVATAAAQRSTRGGLKRLRNGGLNGIRTGGSNSAFIGSTNLLSLWATDTRVLCSVKGSNVSPDSDLSEFLGEAAYAAVPSPMITAKANLPNRISDLRLRLPFLFFIHMSFIIISFLFLLWLCFDRVMLLFND